MDLKHR